MLTLILICGPNGAGKSTFTRTLATQRNLIVIDPDSLAAQGMSPIAAGKAASRIARALLEAGVSFARESTLSSKLDFTLMEEAKTRGYRIILIYIGLDSPELARARVRARKSRGGHDVPEEDIVRRYHRGLANLPRALALADEAVILDNSRGNYCRKDVHRPAAEAAP